MRSHIAIQPKQNPKTKIIKRITVTPIIETTSPLIDTHYQPIENKNEQLNNITHNEVTVPQIDMIRTPHQGNNHIQTKIIQNNQSIHIRKNIYNRRSNRSASRSQGKRIFNKSPQQKFANSYIIQDSSQNNIQNHQIQNIEEPNRQVFVNSQLSESRNKQLQNTRAKFLASPNRESRSVMNESYVTMQVQVFSYPTTIPQVCCKVKHK